MALNRQQLAKILELMGSAHDGEALAAARRAHMLVKNSGTTWQAVLGAQAMPSPGPAATTRSADRPGHDRTPPRPTGAYGRELTSYEMLYALLHSHRTPPLIKKRLKPLEGKVADGDVDEEVLRELRALFTRYVVISAGA